MIAKHKYLAKTTCLCLILFILLSSSSFYVSGQQAQSSEERYWERKGAETFNYDLPDSVKNRFIHLNNFLKNRIRKEYRFPFLPVIAVHLKYLGYDSLQVWIGKRTLNDVNDYILIILQGGKNISYDNGSAVDNFRAAANHAKQCTIIVLSDLKNQKDGQSATYYSVRLNQMMNLFPYIQNFDSYRKKFGLEKDFPYTFILIPDKEDKAEKIRIYARSHLNPNGLGAANKPANYFLQVSATAGNIEDNYVELEAIEDGDVCCQSPPRQAT